MEKKLLLQKFFLPALLLIFNGIFSQNVVTVTDCNLNGWVKQPVGNSSLGFISGPSVPPLGKGSLKFYVPPGTNPDWPGDFVRFRNGQYSGTPLSSLTELSYETYVESRDTIADIPFMVILVDINGDGSAEHNLVFDPRYQNPDFIRSTMPDQGITREHEWQKWDCLQAGWFFGGNTDTDPDHDGPFFTLAEYMKLYPNATIRNDVAKGGPAIRLTAGGVVFKANFYGEMDAFKIGINGVTTTYDFEFTTANAGEDKQVVYGYGANCISLNGSAAGGEPPYTYAWSAGLTSGNNANIVCPVVTTNYTLTVTDSKGCVRTDEVIVNVNDVRCGNRLDKVSVCHKGGEICVAKEAVTAHLKHGDMLGSCDELFKGNNSYTERENAPSVLKLMNQPNPFSGTTRIGYELPADGTVSLQVFDFSGRVLAVLVNGNRKRGKYTVDFASANLSPGVYYYRMQLFSGNNIFSQVNKMIVTRR